MTPEEIAGLIERLERCLSMLAEQNFPHVRAQIMCAAAALRSQAAEVERLTRHCQVANTDREHDADKIERLEAERDEWKTRALGCGYVEL